MLTRSKVLLAREHLPGFLVFLGCLGLATADIFWGFWDHDSGFYLNQSAMIASGLKPFVDFATIYPPLFNALNAIPMALGASHWTLVWAIPLFWISANSALTAIYLRRALPATYPAWSPWIAGGTFALFCIDSGGNHDTLEHGVVFFGIASLLAFRTQWPWRFLAVGALVACATLSKQVGILLLLPFLTQVRTRRELFELSLGFALPVMACAAWLQFDVDAVEGSSYLLGAYVRGTDPFTLWNLCKGLVAVFVSDFRRAPWIFFFSFALCAMGTLSAVRLARERDWRNAAWLCSWMLVAVLYFGARARNNYPHYTINCWPSVLVIIGAGSHVLSRQVYSRVLRLALGLSIGFTVLLSARLHDIGGAPYFTRWEKGGRIFFLRSVAEDIHRGAPVGASITHLGLEESVILFLAGRLPENKDWTAMDMVAPIRGDGILFTDYGQESAANWKTRFERLGYRIANEWSSPGWGLVQLYWK
jgi:hypothetical protein